MQNPCYLPGAIWKTRKRIKSTLSQAFDEWRQKKDLGYSMFPRKPSVVIPRGEVILLLSYRSVENFHEHIKFLWNEKIYIAFYVDSGSDFFINPNGNNTKRKK